MDYKRCKEIAIANDIKSANQWFQFTKGNKDIPTHPERKFKKEWVSWFNFLEKEKDQRKYKVNDNFFKKIDRNSSYILGLWARNFSTIQTAIFSCGFRSRNFQFSNKLNK